MHPLFRSERGAVPLLAIIAVGVVAVLTFGYALVGALADYFAARIPDKLEAEMFGNLGARQSQWKAEPTTDDENRVFVTFKRLTDKGESLRELTYKAYIMKEKSPNAFAIPGGNVGVTSGLAEMVKSEIGMALVLGHELGHHQFRHGMKMLGRRLAYAVILAFIMGGDGAAGAALDFAAKAHSRDQELEADAFGMRLVMKAYGTTQGALEFFEKLETKAETKDHKMLAMLSSHPYTPDRIARMKKIAKELESAATPPPDEAAAPVKTVKAQKKGKPPKAKKGKKTDK